MADNTGIEWTDATWNPVTGCTKVSPGCDHCYAETFAERWRGTPGHHFEQGFDLVLRPDRLEQPLRWTRPRRIFVNSMSDLFHQDVPDEYLDRVFDVMEQARQHTFQVLTKRHARMRAYLRARAEKRWQYADKFEGTPTPGMQVSPAASHARLWATNPPPNIWVGVSVENQHWADIRIPALIDTPAAVRFLSCEPLLGPVDLWRSVCPHALAWRGTTTTPPQRRDCCDTAVSEIGWVIVGGESGRGARPMHPDWPRSLRDQCVAAGVPYLFKQLGALLARELGVPGKGEKWDDLPAEFQIRDYPVAVNANA